MADFLADFDLATGDDDGSSWANAFQTPGTMDSGISAGDRVYIQGTHSQSATLSLTPPGTVTNPNIFTGVKNGTTNDPVEETDVVDDFDDADIPAITTTSSGDIAWNKFARWWGVKFTMGDDFRSASNSDSGWIMEQCHFVIGGASGDKLSCGTTNGAQYLELINPKIDLSSAANKIESDRGTFIIKNPTMAGTASTGFLFVTNYPGTIDVYGGDLSNLGSAALIDFDETLITLHGTRLGTSFVLINARNGDSWSAVARAHLSRAGTSISDPITDFLESYQMGDNTDETTIVRADGASDGVTSHSIKMSPADNSVTESVLGLRSPKIIGWVGSDQVGVSTNFDVFIHNTGADKDDDEVWLELFLPTNDSAQLSFNSTILTPLATVAAITDDASLWNGSANFSQRLRITATPDHQGPIFGWVYYAKRGTSIDALYVDPKIYVASA